MSVAFTKEGSAETASPPRRERRAGTAIPFQGLHSIISSATLYRDINLSHVIAVLGRRKSSAQLEKPCAQIEAVAS